MRQLISNEEKRKSKIEALQVVQSIWLEVVMVMGTGQEASRLREIADALADEVIIPSEAIEKAFALFSRVRNCGGES